MISFKHNRPPAIVKQGPREPLYEFSDLAREFEVLPGQLNNAMRRSPIPVPEPKMVKGRRRWWSMREMIAWWVEVGGKDFAVSDKADYYSEYRRKGKSVLTSNQTIQA